MSAQWHERDESHDVPDPDEVRGDEPGLMDAAQTDGPIGRCSVCRQEVRWSEAKRPLTSPPVHADCLEPLRDDQARTPPHGDPLMGGAATARAMAGPEIPHNEAGVPIMPEKAHCKTCGLEVCTNCGQVYFNTSGMMCTDEWHQTNPGARRSGVWQNCDDCGGLLLQTALAVNPPPHRPPSHIERAARKAWRAGYEAAEYDRRHPGSERLNDDAGLDAFLCSLQADAEAVLAATADDNPQTTVKRCDTCGQVIRFRKRTFRRRLAATADAPPTEKMEHVLRREFNEVCEEFEIFRDEYERGAVLDLLVRAALSAQKEGT